MNMNSFILWKDFMLRPEYKRARTIFVRDEQEEYGSFNVSPSTLPAGWGWLLKHYVNTATIKFDAVNRYCYVRIK